MGSENEAKGKNRKKERKNKKPKKGNTELHLNDRAFKKKRGEYATSKPLEEEERKRKKGINVDTEKAIHVSEEGENRYATSKPLEEKKRKRKKRINVDTEKAVRISEEGDNRYATSKPLEEKKREGKKGINVDTEKLVRISEEGDNRYATSKPLEEKKRKRKKGINVDTEKAVRISEEEDKSFKAAEEKNKNKPRKKKRKGEKKNDDEIGIYEKRGAKADDSLEAKNRGLSIADVGMEMKTGKSKVAKKKRKNDDHTVKKGDLLLKEKEDIDQDDVYHISSGDEDCSTGMKKWITEYHQSRPGLKVLQQRIDDFMSAHEARLEQERKEREAQAAEGGWTVVVHHKGRKKTTDSESGITVGSVAQAAVEDKLTKKKHKEIVGLDFYRFKKRDDRRNEILTLQSKFEQDKKRIQQMRAARKFKPY